MIGADIVISRQVNGQPDVADYHATQHLPPQLDSAAGGTNNIRVSAASRGGVHAAVLARACAHARMGAGSTRTHTFQFQQRKT